MALAPVVSLSSSFIYLFIIIIICGAAHLFETCCLPAIMEAELSRTDAGSLEVFFVSAFQDLRTLAAVSMNFWGYYWQVLVPRVLA